MEHRQYPPGTIGISASGYGWRSNASVMSLLSCWKPEGTHISIAESIDIPENLNKIIRAMSPESGWLWIQADDHRWGGQALRTLLDAQVDVVVPLILRRGPPFVPLIYKELTPEGYVPFGYDELPAKGLVECRMAATGGLLIRKHVLDAIGDPWFEYQAGENLNEDFLFMERVFQAGYKIHACVDVVMGHIGSFTIWPHLGPNGKWRIGFDMGEGKTGKSSTFFLDPADPPRSDT